MAKTNYSISQNIFSHNSGLLEGGALKWLGLFIPEIDKSNQFIENKAIYGCDVAAFPIRLRIIVNQYIYDSYSSRYFDSNFMNQSILLTNASSGQQFPYFFNLQLFDIYDNPVFINSGS